ncbi:MAG: T9SS type A sorting domain-containing protein [Chitinophagaceae bacterium]|nr:T9SS type A sorting domain-containing protein [Chitinophagaceae bacterium]
MAFIRTWSLTVLLAVAFGNVRAQTVYYPANASQLLKATAADMAQLLNKAMPAGRLSHTPYTQMPQNGIILLYDSTISGNQSCRVESDGSTFIRFHAPQDNGLVYGIYQYLHQSGFRFYQPGSIWEIIPNLNTAFIPIDTLYQSAWKYKSWFISGGANRWVMDNNNEYNWDNYFGENGHNWALYQRRNGMNGAYHFSGHRGDLMTGNYLNSLVNNPCYVATYNGSRQAGAHSVPDIHSMAAMQLWSNTIRDQYDRFRTTINGNPVLYANYYRNFDYRYSHIGIEVPDGAQWGNSSDNGACNNTPYPKASDQHFTLANFTAEKLAIAYPGKQLQLYAYSSHADVPSPVIGINEKIDVQVIPTAFQNETSAKGLMNRWYNKSRSVSEYHYLNIPQWGGETPMFYLDDLQSTLQRIREKNSQGIVWEASPAKFASLPFLRAANEYLAEGVGLNESLSLFCQDMFGAASGTIYDLLSWWSSDRTISTGNFIRDNKYKIPLYLQQLDRAGRQVQNEAPVVKSRINELKVYLHYMVLYYDWLFDQRTHEAKSAKAAALCTYLAKINKLQVVNSYFLIADIVSRYPVSSDFYRQYNINSGTAYQNGNLPLITTADIETDFNRDLAQTGSLISEYSFTSAREAISRFRENQVKPLEKIRVKLLYTNGADYPNRSEFLIDAPRAGNISIAYTPQFRMAGKGYINFTVENADKSLEIIEDFSIGMNDKAGKLDIKLPAAGLYKLSVVSKYQSAVDLEISTNGNYFYKNGPFLGNKTENYRDDIQSLPGYFYVPKGLSRIFFSINNSGPGGKGFATADDISKAFVIKDNVGSTLQPRLVIPNDSAFFYLDVPYGGGGTFWQVQKMEQYNLCFANINNIQWYAQRTGNCSNADFTVSVVQKNGNCITLLTAAAKTGNFEWQISNGSQTLSVSGQRMVELPLGFGPASKVTLALDPDCTVSRDLGLDKQYLTALALCTGVAGNHEQMEVPVLYPNPSSGVFSVSQGKASRAPGEVVVMDSRGRTVGHFRNVGQFNISQVPAGIYTYKLMQNGRVFTGKLVKQ